MKRILILLTLFSILLPAVVKAQRAPRQIFQRKYIQFTEKVDGTVKFNSLLTRNCRDTILNGSSLKLFVQAYRTEKATNYDSTFVTVSSLRPVLYKSNISSEGYIEEVIFNKDSIINKVTHQGKQTVFSKPNINLFNSVIKDDLIANLPLGLNKKFNLKMVNPGKNYVEFLVKIEVLKREKVYLSDISQIDCWKIAVDISGRISYEWFSVVGHVQVKSEVKLDNGVIFKRIMTVS